MSKLKIDWEDKSLEFIQVRYTDVLGKFLARYLTKPANLKDFLRDGIGLDGSSVRGFAHIDDSDLHLLPDITTARVVPIFGDRLIGTVIADVHKGFSQGRINTDPRYASQMMEKYLQEKNMHCKLGPEVECFILDEIRFSEMSRDNNRQQKDYDDVNDDDDNIICSSELENYSRYPIMTRQGYDCPPFQDSA